MGVKTSTLQALVAQGPLELLTTLETSPFVAVIGKIHIWDGAVPTTTTLPIGVNGDRVAFLSDSDGSGGTLTINTSGGQTINEGASPLVIGDLYPYARYIELLYAVRGGDPTWVVQSPSTAIGLSLLANGAANKVFGTDGTGKPVATNPVAGFGFSGDLSDEFSGTVPGSATVTAHILPIPAGTNKMIHIFGFYSTGLGGPPGSSIASTSFIGAAYRDSAGVLVTGSQTQFTSAPFPGPTPFFVGVTVLGNDVRITYLNPTGAPSALASVVNYAIHNAGISLP
jgi:hypothetical protein